MSIIYLNGRFIPKKKANISIEDRGFNFSDGIYEVISFKNFTILNYEQHVSRLKKSLKSLKLNEVFKNFNSLKFIMKYLIRINFISSGFLYLQITRGTAIRNHIFSKNIKPNLLINISPGKNKNSSEKGVKVKTSRDIRWGRCDIKSISLLPNVLCKQAAFESGFFECWQISLEGTITEGTTSNAFIINKNKIIQTHPKNNFILGGVTRDNLIKLAQKNKFKVLEKSFNLKELYSSNEAFLTSTTLGVVAVTHVNETKISNGQIGKMTNELRNIYEEFIYKQLI